MLIQDQQRPYFDNFFWIFLSLSHGLYPNFLWLWRPISERLTNWLMTDFCSSSQSPGLKRSEHLVDQRDGVVLTPKNVQVCLALHLQCLSYPLALCWSLLLDFLLIHLRLSYCLLFALGKSGLKDSLQCSSQTTQCFGALLGFGMSAFLHFHIKPVRFVLITLSSNVGFGDSSSFRPSNPFSSCNYSGFLEDHSLKFSNQIVKSLSLCVVFYSLSYLLCQLSVQLYFHASQ